MKEFEMVEEMIAHGLPTALLRQIVGIPEKVMYKRMTDHRWHLHGTKVKELYQAYRAIGEEAWICKHNSGVFCTDIHTKCERCGWNETPKARKKPINDLHTKRLDRNLLCVFGIEDLADMLNVNISTILRWEDEGVPRKNRTKLEVLWREHRNDKADERCLYTFGVDCSKHDCEHCGWNPDEERRRMYEAEEE